MSPKGAGVFEKKNPKPLRERPPARRPKRGVCLAPSQRDGAGISVKCPEDRRGPASKTRAVDARVALTVVLYAKGSTAPTEPPAEAKSTPYPAEAKSRASKTPPTYTRSCPSETPRHLSWPDGLKETQARGLAFGL